MSALDTDLLAAVTQYATEMTKQVTFVLGTGTHEKRAELEEYLADLASTSEHIELKVDEHISLRSPMSFTLLSDGEPTGITFSGIPGGHEFSSLVLALLQAGGRALKIDEHTQEQIKAIQRPLAFVTFMSLSCHICPDVVQSLNQMAILNPLISNETIDGDVFPELIAERGIKGVPAVFLDDTLFSSGQVDLGAIFDKLIARHADIFAAPEEQLPVQDVVVVGGGPAGCSAAIYAARKGLDVTIVAQNIGGQVKTTLDIQNLISTPLTTGPKLASDLAAHLSEYPITRRENSMVEQLIPAREAQDNGVSQAADENRAGGDNGTDSALHTLVLNTGEKIEAKTVIIATGAKWRELGVPGEKEHIGNGVAFCAHCDGPFFKGKDIAVVGGGNSGIEAALDLANIVKSVTVLEFLPELKADKVLIEQLAKRDNIRVLTSVAVKEITEDANGTLNAIHYEHRDDGRMDKADVEGVFVQIGLVPHTEFVKDVIETTSRGEIVINDRCETSLPSIYAAGDATTVPYKQIIIAMGEGAKAALSAFDYLLKRQ